MLAPSKIPPEFLAWNERYGAPFGRPEPAWWAGKRFLPWSLTQKYRGPFAFQVNSSLRTFEYPWAFFAVPVRAGMHILEIGGGLSGFQFVLDRHGCRVTNVDPGMDAKGVGWPCDHERIEMLNNLFHTSVELKNTTISDAHLQDDSFDCAYSISVIEHLPEDDLRDVIAHVFRTLKPGGHFVLTVDLFLNLQPFTSREANEFGRNVNVKNMLDLAPFRMVIGDRAHLYGFPEFDHDRIQCQLEQYFVGSYPALSQCLVLQKPTSS